MNSQHPQAHERSWFRSPAGLALLVFLAIAAFFLLTEHTAHVFGLLPFLLLLACLLMHVFMHGGHAGHTGDGAVDEQTKDGNSPSHYYSLQDSEEVKKLTATRQEVGNSPDPQLAQQQQQNHQKGSY